MPSKSTGTVRVALVADLGVALAKVAAAVVTSSPALAAEASHTLTDSANDFLLVLAQRRSIRPPTINISWAMDERPTSGH